MSRGLYSTLSRFWGADQYWHIGQSVLARQAQEGWGAKVIDQLARDLKAEFPELKGFSPRNLKYMRAFAAAWPDPEFVQQLVAQLPWFHANKLTSRSVVG
ncbi:hypothetical protein GCM10017784_33590 [Deinococcus indicus]|uniref:DUF1016 N-terminal domain-containing protein n=1 Tax=Deinococcus indicus TaxID=223556 RepID=UPI0019A469F5|nr:DUF1016 N-terminal domain-containing protein [Deinococcus indicus]GHG36660.1 hypothetical protein GCM10017784_33590 [Deinococcus indicus]